MNPMQLIQMIRNGQDPSSFLVNALRQGQNPMANNVASLIENHDTQGLEALARNLCQSQGKDFDKEFASFIQQMGLK